MWKLGKVNFGMFYLDWVSYGIWKLGKVSFGMFRLGELCDVNMLKQKIQIDKNLSDKTGIF